jgi:hypothetical protein
VTQPASAESSEKGLKPDPDAAKPDDAPGNGCSDHIFRRFFADFSPIFRQFFANFSPIFRRFLQKLLAKDFCASSP